MNEEKKDDELDVLGESKNVEEQTSKKKKKKHKKKGRKKKTTIKRIKNYTQTINLF